ncbi:MAG TPA: phosphoglycerate transporter [Dehalococcoidia bacterium]|jgi:folate-dependent phosphoribosylglycinamide formyltransferase PurN|nr:phosphoglycerate transporter [Dehalococcoidia bacterium]
MYQLGWFSTGRGKGSRGLLQAVQEAISSGEIEAEIAFVFCSREYGETEATDTFLKMVEDYHIPLVTFSYRKFKSKIGPAVSSPKEEALPAWRLDYDREVMARLESFHPDLCVLAGYMLIVGPEMCQKYNMLNLHPAAPGGPKGTWQEVIWQLIESDAHETGAMMHLVTPELDRGPVVTYCTFPIRGEPFDQHWEEIKGQPLEKIKQEQGEDNALFKLIRQHGVARELPLIITTIQAFSQGKVRITADKRVVDAEGRPIHGYDLSAEINKKVSSVL